MCKYVLYGLELQLWYVCLWYVHIEMHGGFVCMCCRYVKYAQSIVCWYIHLCARIAFEQIEQYLVGGLEHFLFFHILGRIIPTDFHIFQRGRYTTIQILYHSLFAGDMHHLLLGWHADRMIRYLFPPLGASPKDYERCRTRKHPHDIPHHSTSFHIIPHHSTILGFLDVLGNIIIH